MISAWIIHSSVNYGYHVSGLRVTIVIYFKMTGKWNLSFIPYAFAIHVHVSHIMTSPRISNFISNALSVLCPEIVKNDTQQKIFSDKILCLILTPKRKRKYYQRIEKETKQTPFFTNLHVHVLSGNDGFWPVHNNCRLYRPFVRHLKSVSDCTVQTVLCIFTLGQIQDGIRVT